MHRRLVLFLSGVVCAAWLLAIAAYLGHLHESWPSTTSRSLDAPPRCELPAAEAACGHRSWKLRTAPELPPITATTIPLSDGQWGLRLCGVHVDDSLFEMGFRDADVLVEIDGWRPTSPRAALAGYGRILAGEVTTVAVSRNGRTRPMTIDAGR